MTKAILIKGPTRCGARYLRDNLIDCGMVAHQVDTSYVNNIAGNNLFAKNLFSDSLNLEGVNLKTDPVYKDFITSVCIVRNPEDSIISHLTQSFYDSLYYKDNIDNFVLNGWKLVENASRIIEDWQTGYSLIRENINEVIPFTFEQLISQPKKVIDIIAKESGYTKDYVFNNVLPQDAEKTDPKETKKENMVSNNTRKGFYLQTSKSAPFYNQIKEALQNRPFLNSAYEEYNLLLTYIKNRQINLSINI